MLHARPLLRRTFQGEGRRAIRSTSAPQSFLKRDRKERSAVPAPLFNRSSQAATLLENLRRSPMTRGNKLDERKRILRAHIASTIESEGVPERLAARVALQLVVRFDERDLGNPRTWSAIGMTLKRETNRLRNDLGLVERQVVVALPKLSAKQIEDFLEELKTSDESVARTILNAALDAADPLTTGRQD